MCWTPHLGAWLKRYVTAVSSFSLFPTKFCSVIWLWLNRLVQTFNKWCCVSWRDDIKRCLPFSCCSHVVFDIKINGGCAGTTAVAFICWFWCFLVNKLRVCGICWEKVPQNKRVSWKVVIKWDSRGQWEGILMAEKICLLSLWDNWDRGTRTTWRKKITNKIHREWGGGFFLNLNFCFIALWRSPFCLNISGDQHNYFVIE